MLTAEPEGWWRRRYRLFDEEGRDLGVVELNWGWGKAGQITVEARLLEIERHRWTGPWVVSADGDRIATVTKLRVFSRSFEIDFDGENYLMQPRLLSSIFDVFVEGRAVGTLRSAGLFSRRIVVDLPDDMPLALRAIATWVVIMVRKRANAAS